MLTPMALPKALLRGSIAALLCLSVAASAQVSNVEGLKPLEGVTIPKIQPSKEIKPGATFKDCDDCPEMVVIPAGSFLMGSGSNISNLVGKKTNDNPEELPQHLVHIQAFSLGRYEVTQAQWIALMGANPSLLQGSELPVEMVSWDDAQEFVKKLRVKTGKNYRLPTEAEWEYAALANSLSGSALNSGITNLSNYAWHSENAGGKTHAVGLKKSNAFGLYDMQGNVWEWTQDCWNQSYAGAPVDGSAWEMGYCSLRVIRGGSWSYFPPMRQISNRYWFTKMTRVNGSGLRIARSD